MYPTITNPQEYYKHLSSVFYLDKISHPVMIIQSENDFCVPLSIVPIDKIVEKDNLFYVGVPRGGHLEYFTGLNLKRVT